MLPHLVRIGPLTLHSFGLMLAIAFLVTGHLLAGELSRRGLDASLAGTVVTWAVVGGIVGAKLYYLVEHASEVVQAPLALIFSGSGLVAYGGFAGGILLSWLAIRRRGAPVLAVFDAAAPLLALGYAIGRVGCLLAGDGDYGPPSELPWAMAFPRGVVPTNARVHPTPLYETLIMTGVFALLWRLRHRPWPAGRMFALYLVVAGAERLVIEHWRINPPVLGQLSGAQVAAIGSIATGLLWLGALDLGRREPGANQQ